MIPSIFHTAMSFHALYEWLDSSFGCRVVHQDEFGLHECPECGGRNKCFVNPVKGFVNCYRCGRGWRLMDWIQQQTGWTENQAWMMVYADEVRLSEFDRRATQFKTATTPPVPKPAWRADFFQVGTTSDSWDESAKRYLLGRGFGEIYWRTYQLAYAPAPSPYANRIVIPVFEQGQPVYFQARTWVHGEKLRYKNPSVEEGYRGKGEVVFNLDHAAAFDTIYLCEGAFTAMATGINAVATFGLHLSERQRSLLTATPARAVVVVLDYGADKARQKILTALQGLGKRVGYVEMPDERDVNDHFLAGGRQQVDALLAGVRWLDAWSVPIAPAFIR